MQINTIEYFSQTCNRWSNKTAVVDRNGSWDFETLSKKARAFASEIVARTSFINTPVAIYLPKGREAIAAILATLFSGNCYAPLDHKAPLLRTKAVLDNLRPALIITSLDLSHQLISSGMDPGQLLIVDEIADDAKSLPERWRQCIDSDPVYIIHTSGSTGKPKGVVITHRGVIDYIEWARACFNIDENCIIGNQAPLIFDNSTLDIFLCFACGATLNLIPEELFIFPVRLLEYMANNLINFIFWVPSIMMNLANKGVLEEVPHLKLTKILFAGEVMPARTLNQWRSRFPDALFANLYGPTEITVDCTYYIVDRDIDNNEPVPIGWPCRNTGILILNSEDQPCQTGERGELCVRGSSLALGYWNEPGQTSAAFVRNPINPHWQELIYRTGDLVYLNENGEIIYVGRKDFQVKHMGYRIELGDIEHFALQVSGIQHACVFYNQEKKEIVLAYEADADIDTSFIREELGKNLPKYMLPNTFRRFPEMPRMANGKINRQQLLKEG